MLNHMQEPMQLRAGTHTISAVSHNPHQRGQISTANSAGSSSSSSSSSTLVASIMAAIATNQRTSSAAATSHQLWASHAGGHVTWLNPSTQNPDPSAAVGISSVSGHLQWPKVHVLDQDALVWDQHVDVAAHPAAGRCSSSSTTAGLGIQSLYYCHRKSQLPDYKKPRRQFEYRWVLDQNGGRILLRRRANGKRYNRWMVAK
eukprot:jgi/Chrzof1/12468/Cz06g35130.t1